MKVGSLVECIGGKRKASDAITQQRIEKGQIKVPSIWNVYVVRGFTPTHRGVLLEEIVNPKVETNEGYIEQGFSIHNFRELQPPMDLTELMEETQCVHIK